MRIKARVGSEMNHERISLAPPLPPPPLTLSSLSYLKPSTQRTSGDRLNVINIITYSNDVIHMYICCSLHIIWSLNN